MPRAIRDRRTIPVRAVVLATAVLVIASWFHATAASSAQTTEPAEETEPAETTEPAEETEPAETTRTTTQTTAQTTKDPVPCEIAMVVGCVATVQGTDGAVSMTLQVTDGGGESTAGQATETGEADGGQLQEVVAEQDDGERPRSGVDPWERGGLRSNFGSRSIPISHYQIGADVTGWLGVPDPLDSFVASQTNWAFTTATFLVILATNSLDWAFEFPLAEDLVGDAGVLAQSYTVDFFGFGLATSVYGLALGVTMVVAGFKAVTKGIIVAGSEVVLAFIAYVVLIVLTLTSGFGNAGLSVARISSELSSSIASFASGQERQAECAAELEAPAAGAQSVPLAGAEANADGSAAPVGATSSACSFGFALQRSLVELPYQNLQWGQVLDGVSGKERCAEINLELLTEGPWGNDDEPRNRMGSAAECEENANFNHQATYIRLGIASANTIAAAAVTLLVLVVAAMLLWQQVKLLFLTVTMPHALVFAILPGRSRKLAWQWIEHLIGVVIRTVILSLGLVVWLSLFSLIVHEQLTLRGIFLSLFASIAMAVSGFYGLYRMSGMTRRVNPASRRIRGGSDSDFDESDGDGAPRTRRAVSGAVSTAQVIGRRSMGRRSAGTGFDDSMIGGGPGDLPGGGAAAPTVRGRGSSRPYPDRGTPTGPSSTESADRWGSAPVGAGRR